MSSEVSEELMLQPAEVGQTLSMLRTVTDRHVDTMERSLRRHGQLTPVLVARLPTGYEMVDGFKRLLAALNLPSVEHLKCRVVATDSRTAKIVMLCQKQVTSGLNEMETALIIRSLHRDEKMSQTEIAASLGRHKSWVCRRLQLAERLSTRAQEDIRVGLLSPTTARALAELPRVNQTRLLDALLQAPLSSRDCARFVKLFQSAKSERERGAMLANPQGALMATCRSRPEGPSSLSSQGQRVFRNILLVERVTMSIVSFLDMAGESEDLALLRPTLEKLERTVTLFLSRLPRGD